MTRLHESAMLCLLVWASLLAGCNDASPPVSTARSANDLSSDALPPLDSAIGPLDDGRLEVAPPEGWAVPPRTDQWLVRFTRTEDGAYPSIQLSVEDYEGLLNATDANVDLLAEQIAAAYDDTAAASQRMTFVPTTAGRLVGVCYQRRAKATLGQKQIVVERLFFDTVVAGRRYTFELRTRDGEIDQYRPYLLAVVAGTRFVEDAT